MVKELRYREEVSASIENFYEVWKRELFYNLDVVFLTKTQTIYNFLDEFFESLYEHN